MVARLVKSKLLIFLVLVVLFLLIQPSLHAQCSICTRTAQQLGEKPAKGLNAGIIYLAFTPLAIFAFLGLRWYRNYKAVEGNV